MSRELIDDIGFLTIAQNTDEVNYLELAYVQAMSIKGTMPCSLYAVIVDEQTNRTLTDKHHAMFDKVIVLPQDYASTDAWKLANEWQVFSLTPFKETIKLESDLVITRDISHWKYLFRNNDIVLSQGCKDYLQNNSNDRMYRRLFDDNNLPDVYSGLMYFRYSAFAHTFFNTAKEIYQNWDKVAQSLKNCRDNKPTTDVVYAITASILGVNRCTLPTDSFVNFVHMKPEINGWANKPFYNTVVVETDLPMVRINNVNQYHPLHYHCKDWVDTNIIQEYEKWMNLQKRS
jgi:hypothetical protein